ncbi:MAG: low molecular weight protein arginine phosphatase [Peptococcaceae bacterium]|nr:low molecular weight protein arginine phosphatase [Candidatus Syntrophopropionicum ammoniitolerans]
MRIKIFFICTGNTCRSCMAEALAGKLLEERFGPNSKISVNSAGLAAFPGDAAAPFAIQVMAGEGINLADHRATLLTEENVREADLILTMTRAHSEQVNSLFPGSDEKVFLLADFAGHGGDVPDPIGQTLETYLQCARKLEEMIIRVLDKLG